MTRYGAYKPSGHEWLGDVPEHWKIVPFRRVFRESSETNGPTPYGPMLSVSGYRGVEVKEYEAVSQIRTDEMLENYRVVHAGQLALNTMWLNYAGLGVSDYEGHMSPAYRAYNIVVPHNPRYIHHLMRSSAYVLGYTGHLRGIRPNSLQMDRAELMVWPILLPPLEEQRAIADFLDRETAKIDALIAKQNQMIDLLGERRRALIWSVTLGQVDHPSASDAWYGTPPAHWNIDKLGRAARIVNGSTPSRENMSYWEGGAFPWLNSSRANQERVSEADQFVTDLALSECHLPRLHPGAVLVGLTGQGKTRGMAALLDMDATINQHLAAIIPSLQSWHSRYLLRVIESAYDELRQQSDEAGSTKGALTCAALNAFRVPRPPLHEQVQIAERLDRATARIDALIAKAEEFVTLAREQRAALITAAVTGQIEVLERVS